MILYTKDYEFYHYVAFLDNNFVGYLCYFPRDKEISNFFIKKEYRKRGYGKKLLDEVKKNEDYFTLSCDGRNINAIEFYNKYFENPPKTVTKNIFGHKLIFYHYDWESELEKEWKKGFSKEFSKEEIQKKN